MAVPCVAGNNSRPLSQELGTAPWEESTNDISHYLGMLDPWYERNVLGLMHLPPEVLCQVSGPWGRGRGPTGCSHPALLRRPWFGEIQLEASMEDQGSLGNEPGG